MSKYETLEPISVTLDLGVGNVRITASDRADTIVEVRPSDEVGEKVRASIAWSAASVSPVTSRLSSGPG